MPNPLKDLDDVENNIHQRLQANYLQGVQNKAQRSISVVDLGDVEKNRRQRLLAKHLQKKQENAHEKSKATQNFQRTSTPHHDDQVTLPNDFLFKILILLPVESLFRLKVVCKTWFRLINSSLFIKCHAEQSATVLVCRKLVQKQPNGGSNYIHFINLDHEENDFVESGINELVDIRASCDGLVLATTKTENLILMNPMTRKHIVLPPTICNVDSHRESYSIAYCNHAKTYKIVHLFKVGSMYDCDILSLDTRRWTLAKGLSSDELLRNIIIRDKSVYIDGSFYWMPHEMGSDYVVSMNLFEEKFVSMKVPGVWNWHDRLVDIGGALGFVQYVEDNSTMVIWILKRNGEIWMKSHSIFMQNLGLGILEAVCCSRNGEQMVFSSSENNLYVYRFGKGDMKQMFCYDSSSSRDDSTRPTPCYRMIEKLYIPHRNTLAWIIG